jgi:hypothetical protein
MCRWGARTALQREKGTMKDEAEKRGKLIKQLEDALLLSEELNDGTATYLIECALDEARAQLFRPPNVA